MSAAPGCTGGSTGSADRTLKRVCDVGALPCADDGRLLPQGGGCQDLKTLPLRERVRQVTRPCPAQGLPIGEVFGSLTHPQRIPAGGSRFTGRGGPHRSEHANPQRALPAGRFFTRSERQGSRRKVNRDPARSNHERRLWPDRVLSSKAARSSLTARGTRRVAQEGRDAQERASRNRGRRPAAPSPCHLSAPLVLSPLCHSSSLLPGEADAVWGFSATTPNSPSSSVSPSATWWARHTSGRSPSAASAAR